MRGGEAALLACALVLIVAGGVAAQEAASGGTQQTARSWKIEYGALRVDQTSNPDFTYWIVDGFLDFRSGDLRVRADRAVLVFDRDEVQAVEREAGADETLPRRDAIGPFAQEAILAARARRRLQRRARALAATGGRATFDVPRGKDRLALLVRAIFAEGHVIFEQQGVRHLRCRKLWLSLVSDRGLMEDVELRLPLGTPLAPKEGSFVLRSPRLVQQGDRLIARDARLTTCEAGEPHFELRIRRVTVTQHPAVTEFLGQGNTLRAGGLPGLPLPDFRFYSDQKNPVPIQSVSAGTSNERGQFVLATFGSGWNDAGQAIVDLFANTDKRFRGTWWLRSGWTGKRGAPVEGGLDYSLPGVLQGRIEGYFLSDNGNDRRSVLRNLDGSVFDTDQRVFTRTANRIALSDDTRLDLELFWAGDPGAYAEFRDRRLKDDEQPETIVHLRHARENRRLSVIGRFNLTDFTYDEKATLGDKFLSQRPYASVDLFSQPLLDLLEGWPLVLSTSVAAGRLRNQFDDHAVSRRSEASWRADIAVDLSAPYALGPLAVQPFFVVRETYYSDRPGVAAGGARTVLEAGGLVATRIARAWDFDSAALGIHGLYHEIRPEVRGFHRFHVDREPGDYFQFDAVDALDELSAIDVTVLNRLQTRRKNAAGDSVADDLVWLDLVQRFFPNSSRDNAGDRLGLLAFELIVRPGAAWLPVPNLRFLFEGERDWNRQDFKTRNLGIAVGPPAGPTLAAEWRSGRDGDGQGSLVVGSSFFRRWHLQGGLIYDFDRTELLSTTISLERRDHDWSWVLLLSRDENTADTSIAVRFLPTLGGLVRRPRTRFIGGDPAFGVRNTANF